MRRLRPWGYAPVGAIARGGTVDAFGSFFMIFMFFGPGRGGAKGEGKHQTPSKPQGVGGFVLVRALFFLMIIFTPQSSNQKEFACTKKRLCVIAYSSISFTRFVTALCARCIADEAFLPLISFRAERRTLVLACVHSMQSSAVV